MVSVLLPARITDIRLLPRVGPHVLNQVAGLRARLTARLTDMFLLRHMRIHVRSQATVLREHLPTFRTVMRYARRLSISSVRSSVIEVSRVL